MSGVARRSRLRVLGHATGFAWVALLAAAGLATAHALPQSSNPSPGSSLEQAPSQVSIVFGEKPDPKLSTIRVLDSTGAAVTSGPTTVAPGNDDELVVPLQSLQAGVYTVAWRTVSAVDGHSAAGSFAFGVGGAAPPPAAGPGGQVTPSGNSIGDLSALGVAARWVMYVGLILMLGASFFGAAVHPGGTKAAKRIVPFAWIAATVGTLGVIATELSDAGVGLGDVFDTSFGPVIVARLMPIALASLGLILLELQPWTDRLVLAGFAVLAAFGMFSDVIASHAAAGMLPILSVAIQWLHIAAVGAWFGGLGGVLLATRGEPNAESGRHVKLYSYIATAGISTVAVTGLIRAVQEVGTIDNLLDTDFGRLVIVKTALLGALALLGAFNHFVNVPRAHRHLRALRWAGSTELLIATTVVLLSASLVNLAPPVEATAGGPASSAAPTPTTAPLVATGNDFGTSVKVTLTISPGTAGFNTFTAQVTDYDTGAPVAAATSMTLRFSLPSRPDIGTSRLDLAPSGQGSGTFTGTGANLSITGTWSVAALVVNGVSSVEVPLTVTTRCPPVASGPLASPSVNAEPGLPTIYTVDLGNGLTVQVYLDPGTAGANEEHATFFDAKGVELPVQTASMSIGTAGCALAPLTPRLLEPGHFVADVKLDAGTYTTTISGPAPNGQQLTATFNVDVGAATSSPAPATESPAATAVSP